MDDESGMCFTTSKQGNKSIYLGVVSWLAWYSGLYRLVPVDSLVVSQMVHDD